MEDNPEKQKRFQGEVLRFQARWGDLLAAGDPCTCLLYTSRCV